MEAVLRVVPVPGETTWSFLHRVAAAYRLQVSDLAAWWRWVSPVRHRYSGRPDGEVLLDAVAQGQLADWCRVPAVHLARALPSWAAGPQALAEHGRAKDRPEQDGAGRAWWRLGASQWGPVAFGCRLCAVRRRAGSGPVWVYRPPWQRLCVRRSRWLLDVGEGHSLEFADVAAWAGELGRARHRWAGVMRAAGAGGVAPGEVFALARAVVCGWWEREVVWGPRLEQLVAAMIGRGVDPVGWGDRQWRLVARDVVVFPDIVAVAQALGDLRLWERAGQGAGGLLRDRAGAERFAAALGGRLGRPWLGEVEAAGPAGPLARWVSAMARERRRPGGAPPLRGMRGVWWVRGPHRPLEVGAGLRLLAQSPDAGTVGAPHTVVGEGMRRAGDAAAAAERGGCSGGPAALAVPRRAWHGQGLTRWHAQLFAEGLEHARRHAQRFGHLALAHTERGVVEGFDLGRPPRGARAGRASGAVRRAAPGQPLRGALIATAPVGRGVGGLDLLSIHCENARRDGEHETVVE
ncbi:hypothetical protein ABT382_26360 [Streptomyces pharetrae]|uniref:hypothetical protein n=1 Tax=Streptomyces pharetrae TaxID=291370 RepID=UPI0033561807